MPQLQPFWDARYDLNNQGPYVGKTYADNIWDTAKILGIQVPGIVTLSVSRAKALWVIQFPSVAPRPIDIGWEPLRFTMTVKLWTPHQWAAMQPIMWAMQPINERATQTAAAVKAQRGAAFDVYHPQLAAWSVGSAICERMGPLAGDQVKTLTLQFLEYRKGDTAVKVIQQSRAVVDQYSVNAFRASVAAVNGANTPVNPTHGPQQPPSNAPSLTPTP